MNIAGLTQNQPYFIGAQQYAPATAVASPANVALNVPAGQFGGQGMAYPQGASTAPTGAAGGAGASNLIGGLSDAAQQYVAADQIKNAPLPLSIKLAQFSAPQLEQKPVIYG